jgi:hypothetical protein
LDPVHASWTTSSGRSTVDPHGGADGKPPESGRRGAPACRCSPVAAGKGNGGHGGPGAAAAQPGCGGALLSLRRTKASGARSSGREGGVTGLVGRGGGLDVLGRPAGHGRESGRAGWAEWAEFGGKKFFLNKKLDF